MLQTREQLKFSEIHLSMDLACDFTVAKPQCWLCKGAVPGCLLRGRYTIFLRNLSFCNPQVTPPPQPYVRSCFRPTMFQISWRYWQDTLLKTIWTWFTRLQTGLHLVIITNIEQSCMVPRLASLVDTAWRHGFLTSVHGGHLVWLWSFLMDVNAVWFDPERIFRLPCPLCLFPLSNTFVISLNVFLILRSRNN